MARFNPAARVAQNRYLIVPCEGRSSDLAVIWDRLEEQVVDVVNLKAAPRWTEEDALWEEARGGYGAEAAEPMRLAA